MPNIALNRSAAIWHFMYFLASRGRARLALRYTSTELNGETIGKPAFQACP